MAFEERSFDFFKIASQGFWFCRQSAWPSATLMLIRVGLAYLVFSPVAWSQSAETSQTEEPSIVAERDRSASGDFDQQRRVEEDLSDQRSCADEADRTESIDGQAHDSETPPARKSYLGRQIAPTMSYAHAGWLVRSERQQEEDPKTALEQLKLKPGMVVCDMGCGNGFYSMQMAKQVNPGGKVLAVDIQQEMLHLLHLRAEELGVDNIETVLGELTDPHLPSASIDLVLMVDVYHEFSHPEQMLAAIRKSLKPGGRIALLEFRAEDPKVPILPLHKMSKRQILREYRANGFKLAGQFDDLPWQHLMFFESDPDWKPRSAGNKNTSN